MQKIILQTSTTEYKYQPWNTTSQMAFLLHGLTLVKFVICNYFNESGPNILCINRLPSPSLVSLRKYAIKTKNTSQRKTQLIALSLIWSKSRFRLHRSGQELMRLFSRALDPPLRGHRTVVLCQVVKQYLMWLWMYMLLVNHFLRLPRSSGHPCRMVRTKMKL